MPKILATDKRWSSLYKFGTIADPQLKSALADSDVLAKYMDGDFTQYQALKKEIEVAQKAIQVTLASAPKRKKPLAPKTTRKPKERYSQGATYVGVKSNLVFRLAEIEEANLTRLVRQALVPFAWQWTDVAMSKR